MLSVQVICKKTSTTIKFLQKLFKSQFFYRWCLFPFPGVQWQHKAAVSASHCKTLTAPGALPSRSASTSTTTTRTTLTRTPSCKTSSPAFTTAAEKRRNRRRTTLGDDRS